LKEVRVIGDDPYQLRESFKHELPDSFHTLIGLLDTFYV